MNTAKITEGDSVRLIKDQSPYSSNDIFRVHSVLLTTEQYYIFEKEVYDHYHPLLEGQPKYLSYLSGIWVNADEIVKIAKV